LTTRNEKTTTNGFVSRTGVIDRLTQQTRFGFAALPWAGCAGLMNANALTVCPTSAQPATAAS